jgi:hypothetical protein
MLFLLKETNVKSLIAQKILMSMDLPGSVIKDVLGEYQGKKINIEEMKELVTKLVAEVEHNGKVEEVDSKEIKELLKDMKDDQVWAAMGIKIPSTNIKYIASEGEELKFASEDEAIQFLSDKLGKKVIIEE